VRTRARTTHPVAEPRALVGPAWAWYLIFFVVPLGFIVLYALASNDPDEFFVVRFGFDTAQFERLADRIYLRIYWDTFVMASTGTLGCLVIGYPFAYYLATKVGPNRTVLLLLVVVPFWTSLLIRTYAWVIILGEQGPLSGLLQQVRFLSNPLNILYTPTAVWVGVVYDYLPLMVFPLYVALERLDPRLAEASRDLGVGRWGTFRRVTLPLSLPGVMTGCLLTFIPMMGEYVVPEILGGAKSFLVGSLVANQILTAIDWPFGAAIALGLIVALLIVIAIYLRVVGRSAEQSLGAAL
jgi:spermidine/putrescine transport system permease protein